MHKEKRQWLDKCPLEWNILYGSKKKKRLRAVPLILYDPVCQNAEKLNLIWLPSSSLAKAVGGQQQT